MKHMHKFAILALSCFCVADLVLIQSGFFLPCGSQPRNYTLQPTYCDNLWMLEDRFSTAAGIAIAAIVGISAYHSPKKSMVIVLALGGLFLFSIVLYQLYMLSLHDISLNVGITRPMTGTEKMMQTVVHSPLWHVTSLAVIMICSITWSVVVLRKKMMGILR